MTKRYWMHWFDDLTEFEVSVCYGEHIDDDITWTDISLTTWYHQYVQCSVFVAAHPHYTAQPQMRWSKPFPPSGASTGWIDSHGLGNHSWDRVKCKNYCGWAKLGTNLSDEGWKGNLFISGKVSADHILLC